LFFLKFDDGLRCGHKRLPPEAQFIFHFENGRIHLIAGQPFYGLVIYIHMVQVMLDIDLNSPVRQNWCIGDPGGLMLLPQ
jgi:hypothetical protein